ncbi:MAG TPA: LysE family translocator [Pararhizobium sp.]|nr:LysE family translocator [Pararhizobium sp.]
MDIVSLAVFAGALFVAAGAPGPSIAALVSRVLARGARDVVPFVAAMWFGECIWISLAVFGLSAIAHTFEMLFVAIKYAGVAYLMFLAWKMWFTVPHAGETDRAPPRKSPVRMFLAGLAVTLGNPKIMLFYMALLPTLIDLTHVRMLGWAELVVTSVSVLAVVDTLWITLAARARLLLRSPRAVRFVNRGSAAVMAGAAVAIATR